MAALCKSRHSIRVCATIALIAFLLQHASALSLVDNIALTNKEILISEPVSVSATFLPSSGIESNLEELMAQDTYSDSDIRITSVFGYQLDPEMKYLVSPDRIHVFDKDDVYQRTILYEHTDAGTSFSAVYLESLEDEAAVYRKAGFPCLPEFHYSLLQNDDCYFNQREQGLRCGCTPTSVSMAMRISGVRDFDCKDLYNAIGKTGVNLKTEGISIGDVVHIIQNWGYLESHSFYTEYQELRYFDELLDGNPLIVSLRNNFTPDSGNRFIRISGQPDGYHCIVICGFFIAGDRTGYEVYDPDGNPRHKNGKGAFIWEKSVNRLSKPDSGYAYVLRLKDELERPTLPLMVSDILELD